MLTLSTVRVAKAPGRSGRSDRQRKNSAKLFLALLIKAAAAAAGLSNAVTAYTLRHSVITDLVTNGLDLLTVAQLSGTSVAMIEKHYGHHREDHAANALAGLNF